MGMVWAESSTAAAICRYRAAGLPPAGLHTPVPGVRCRAVLPPENTAHESISNVGSIAAKLNYSKLTVFEFGGICLVSFHLC